MLALIFTLNCTLSPTPTPASPRFEPASSLMLVLDRDGDGRLSSQEFRSVSLPSATMADGDKNEDRFISITELEEILWATPALVDSHRHLLTQDPKSEPQLGSR
jgi:hypothetical protein